MPDHADTSSSSSSSSSGDGRCNVSRLRSRSIIVARVCAIVAFIVAYLCEAVAAAPTISSLSPSIIAPAAAASSSASSADARITIEGDGFGSNATELLAVYLLQQAPSREGWSGASLPSSRLQRSPVPCAEVQWLSAQRATCLPPADLPANFMYRIQMNVSGILSDADDASTVHVSTAGNVLDVSCYASDLCGYCYLSPPPASSSFFLARSSPMDHSGDMSDSLPMWSAALLVVGGACVMLLLLLVGLIVWRRRRRRGRARVKQDDTLVRRPRASSMLASAAAGASSSAAAVASALASVPSGVMISYSHSNSPFALRLEAELTKAGFEVWIDTKIIPGEDWRNNIAQAIERSFAVVVVLSPASVSSKYCKEEIYYAAQTKRQLFPLVHIDCWSALKGGLKMLLQRIQWIQFERDGWDASFPRLVANLRSTQEDMKKKAQAQALKVMEQRQRALAEIDAAGGMPVNAQLQLLHSVSTRVHRLQPVLFDVDAAALESENDDEEGHGADADDGAGGEQGGDAVTKHATHAASGGDASPNPPLARLRTRLPELSDELHHAPTHSAPADAYICVDGWSASDQAIAEQVRASLVAHGMSVYVSQHPKAHLKAMKTVARCGGVQHVLAISTAAAAQAGLGSSDGRASPSPRPESARSHAVTENAGAAGGGGGGWSSVRAKHGALLERDHRASPSHSRRPSLFLVANAAMNLMHEKNATEADPLDFLAAREQVSPTDGTQQQQQQQQHPSGSPPRPLGLISPITGGGGGGGSGCSTPVPSFPPLRRPSLSVLAGGGLAGGSGGDNVLEDLFELNASRIDASTFMIFIASACSFKSADCVDELHYGYEVSKPMLQLRTDSAGGEKFHAGLLHGSVGMMLQTVPSIHWDEDGAEVGELAALAHVSKHKLAALRAKSRAEKEKIKQQAAVPASGAGDGAAAGQAPQPAADDAVISQPILPHVAWPSSSAAPAPDHSPLTARDIGLACGSWVAPASAASPVTAEWSPLRPQSAVPSSSPGDGSSVAVVSPVPHVAAAGVELSPLSPAAVPAHRQSPHQAHQQQSSSPLLLPLRSPSPVSASGARSGQLSHRRLPSSRVPADSPVRSGVQQGVTSSAVTTMHMTPLTVAERLPTPVAAPAPQPPQSLQHASPPLRSSPSPPDSARSSMQKFTIQRKPSVEQRQQAAAAAASAAAASAAASAVALPPGEPTPAPTAASDPAPL